MEPSLLILSVLWCSIFPIIGCSSKAKYETAPSTTDYNRSSHTRRFSSEIIQDTPEIYFLPTYYQQQSEVEISESPNDILRIHVNKNKLSILCVAPHNSEGVTWVKYDCPSQVNKNEAGHLVATDALVTDPSSYAVHFMRRSGQTISELVLKHPLLPPNDGVYVCESLIANEDHTHYPFYKMKDIFFIGGSNFIEKCYH